MSEGRSGRGIPRGIEVLVKKASVDAEFRQLLLEKRAEAAREIGLELEAAEVAMLASIPARQLEAIIDRTGVSPRLRKAFMGGMAAVMLAALGVSTAGCDRPGPTTGERPDRPEGRGVVARPSPPRPATQGIRPEPVEASPRTRADAPDDERGSETGPGTEVTDQ